MLSTVQEEALQNICLGHNLVITGQAGTGKSFLLKRAYQNLLNEGKRPVILCSTGMACLQYLDCRSSTVHSWAGLCDGRYDNLTLLNLLKDDDAFERTRKNVSDTDVILIDEVSMLSLKDFEQLELVCRTMHNPYMNFGGLQVVVSGDFYQLPPVGNPLYGDSGKFCFQSTVWKSFFGHHINLKDVIRQREAALIKAVQESACGSVSLDTDIFLKKLERELDPSYKPIHLFPTNYDARLFNHDQLKKIPSEGKVYKALKNNGPEKHLKRILAPIYLQVKIGCSVVLLRNLGGRLMNGLKGTVIALSDDAIMVLFEILNEVHSIKRYQFTVVDMKDQSIVAEREQFPLCLAYGLTIHKSQGMTLESVCIHCKGIFESGQLSVALGRGTHAAGIQLLNYRRGLCFQPKPIVTEFYRNQCTPFEESLSCCKYSKTVCIPDESLCIYDSDHSDFDDGDTETVAELSHHIVQDDNSLPQFVDLAEIKASVIIPNPFNEKQRKITALCQSMSDQQLKSFLAENYKNLETFLPSTEGKTNSNTWTETLSKYHMYVSDENFKCTLSTLYGLTSFSDIHIFVASKLIYKLLQLSVHSIATKVAAKEPAINTLSQQSSSEAGNAKLRYVGGMCIAKAKQKYCGLVENNIGNEKKDVPEKITTNTEKVNLLRSMTAEMDEIDLNDESFSEIERRQNTRKGLTYINENCFKFFQLLDSKVKSILNGNKLSTEKANIFVTTRKEILDDENLKMAWSNMTFGINSQSSLPVFEDIVCRFLMVSEKQFLKDMKDSLSLKKKKAHRAELNSKLGKRKLDVELSFKDIIEDNSEKKISSHLKLKCNSIGNKDFLMSHEFTKQQLLTLAKAYNVRCSRTCNKENIANLLVDAILKFDLVPNPEALTQSVPAQQTDVTIHTGKGKGKGKCKKSKKYYCGRCEKEYNENEDWIECCSCKFWFDRTCANLLDETEWDTVIADDIDWECQQCRS